MTRATLRNLQIFSILDRYHEEIVATPGFGQKSYDNLMDSVEKARNVELSALIYSWVFQILVQPMPSLFARRLTITLKK